MYEHLQFQLRTTVDGGNLLRRQFTCQHHARKAHLLKLLCARQVVHAHLRRAVQCQRRADLPCQLRDGQVLHDQRVGAAASDQLQFL